MNNSRHSACKLCRDRKVRCDGEQPACERCRRAGEICVYCPPSNPTKADLLQTIGTLQDRLEVRLIGGCSAEGTAEAYLFEQAQMINSGYNHPVSVPDSAISVQQPDSSAFNMPMPSFVNASDPIIPSSCDVYQSISPFQDSFDCDFLSCLPDIGSTEQVGAQQVHLENMVLGGNNGIPLDQWHQAHSQIPNLQELRAFKTQSSSGGTPSSRGSLSSRTMESERCEDCRSIISEVTSFYSTVRANQAAIAGISSVVADYLAWVRKRPSRSSRGAALEANVAGLLETLELRVRELHDMAETRHGAALERILTVPKTDGLDAQLSAFREEVQERLEKTKRFFQESYDVTVALPEQIEHD